MRYLFCLIFLIGSYIFPFVISYKLVIWSDNSGEAGMGTALLMYFSYLLLYVLRFVVFIIIALISFCFKNYFMRLYRYNSLVILLLFIVDLILYNTLGSITGVDFYKAEGFLRSIIFLSLSSTYFPFWLVFGIRNAICYIKDLKNARKGLL